mgnify:CR=1 FL=1
MSDLEITDEAALLKSLMAHDLKDGYEVTTKIVKKAVERMVRSGDTRIAGAVIRKGERVGYTVKKELLDNAKNTGVIRICFTPPRTPECHMLHLLKLIAMIIQVSPECHMLHLRKLIWTRSIIWSAASCRRLWRSLPAPVVLR